VSAGSIGNRGHGSPGVGTGGADPSAGSGLGPASGAHAAASRWART
jgi:hypothetical protein